MPDRSENRDRNPTRDSPSEPTTRRTDSQETATEPAPADTVESASETTQPPDREAVRATSATVTPYAVEGDVAYDRLIDEFGADPLTDQQARRFPDHPAIRRRICYAGRHLESYLDAADAERPHAIVTGRGPSGPMHLGHVLPLYLTKRFQDETGATVYLALSDDEKFLAKALSFEEIGAYTRDNLRDVLAVGFDPDRTRIIVDTVDADVVYPVSVRLAKHLTPATVEAVYGEQTTVGLQFYPAVQATHLLLPQLVEGRQPTLVPIAIDQDPHVRVCCDVADKEGLPVDKPGALLGRFLPRLDGPGKMSSSDDAPTISLMDEPETVAETIRRHAYSGGKATVDAHREHGGDPAVDVPFQYLRYGFEPDDERLEAIADAYRSGDLLSGELKELAIERITEFLADHQRRRAALGPLEVELEPYRLTEKERRQALGRAGVPTLG